MGPNPTEWRWNDYWKYLQLSLYIHLQTALQMSTFLSFLGLLCLAQVTLKALPPFDSVSFGKTNQINKQFCHFMLLLKAPQGLFCLDFVKSNEKLLSFTQPRSKKKKQFFLKPYRVDCPTIATNTSTMYLFPIYWMYIFVY